MEVETMPTLERVEKHMAEDYEGRSSVDRTSHAASTAKTTDSMVSVPLSTGQVSELGHTRHESEESLVSDVSDGSIELDSDYEDAVVEEAVTLTRARGGSITTLRHGEHKADSVRSVPAERPATPVLEDEGAPLVRMTSSGAGPIEPRHTSVSIVEQLHEAAQVDENDSLEAEEPMPTKPEITLDMGMIRSRPSSVTSFDAVQSAAAHRRSVRSSGNFEARGLDRMSTLDMEDALGAIEEKEEHDDNSYHRQRADSASSVTTSPVDWARLDRHEQQEQQGADEDEQTALLLARLEQENQAIATDSKVALAKQRARKLTAGRPPSIYEVKSLVQKSHRQSIRLSRMPSPPPMTELDFWAALVQDYPATAQRLPTLTSNKIRNGIPPPLRGVVWVSMAGARDKLLEEQYDRLCGEQSPYENIISKDIGRSFPGVEMFRDPEGEGQRMLGRVLKCFSLHDTKIGYCQGLGFLVGPLLMQMGERDAFCVLVRLMEDYDLRSCFQEDLSGLHLRVYQFQQLLHQHLPTLAAHLDLMQVEAAYLSQWFLSFFAVTCPLPMLFRIYDVVFAEGASETIMRVALSVMRRNEKKILALAEFEDIMQLLLGRALWDTYGLHKGSGDELVNDFVSFTSLVTRENLRELDASFKAAQNNDSGNILSFLPDVQSAASKFLGRLWAPATPAPVTRSAHLSPTTTPGGVSGSSTRPGSLLRRSASAQSIASSQKSNEGVSDSVASSGATTMTDATSFSRIMSDDYAGSMKSGKTQMGSIEVVALKPNTTTNQDQQIEDLLMALSDMQREHAQLAAQLAKEREEREEDAQTVRNLLDGFNGEQRPSEQLSEGVQSRRRTTPATRRPVSVGAQDGEQDTEKARSSHRLSKLLASAEYRFPLTPGHQRHSVTLETRSQLREALAQARGHTASESSRATDLARQLEEKERETASAREELREARSRIQVEFSEKQRLEKTVLELRTTRRKSNANTSPPRRQTLMGSDQLAGAIAEITTRSRSNSGSSNKSAGLRELRLGRSQTAANPQQFGKRTSSLATQAILGSLATNVPPVPSFPSAVSTVSEEAGPPTQDQQDREALLLELVNAKTAEAVARQELDEMRGRYDSMRKTLLAQQNSASASPAASNHTTPVTTPAAVSHKANPSEGFLSFMNSAATNIASAVTPVSKETVALEVPKSPDPEKRHAPAGSWGWGWGKRNVTS